MNRLDLQNYNLELTLIGGQSFTWDKVENKYIGTYKDNLIIIEPKDNHIYWEILPNNDINILIDYLNINLDYESIVNIIKKDEFIINAIEQNNGIRILKQDFQTVLMNFILSSHKSVKGVRKLVKDISKKYGKKLESIYGTFYSFPSAEVISKLTEKELREIGAGFRAPYLKEAAEKLVNDKDFIRNIEPKTTDEVKQYLLSFKGIGEKIADCILVFGLNRFDVTPLDIWGKRVLVQFYNLNPKLKYSEMSEWYSNYFGENTAIAGQFLFEYIRNLPKANTAK